jgi:putative DNA primase/helicase
MKENVTDPYTPGPPILRDAESLDSQPSTLNPPPNPEPRTANPEPATLLNDLWCLINRFVVLPDMAAETLALWIVHTYAFTLRQVTTYIGVVSPEKRCGKTTLLELLGLLANRSLTAANISPSALFRVIEETKPTLLIDEADTFLQGRDELAGILNAGYRKSNSYVVRVAEGKARKKDEQTCKPAFGQWSPNLGDSLNAQPSTLNSDFAQYSCWCPKVMAAIGRLPDTLADRCIIITMQRKMPGEKCERMRHLDATEYRQRCAEFVHEHSEAIARARPEIPSVLNDRAADIWEPLLAIADLAGGEWPQLAREAARQLSGVDDEMTLVGYFLKDLRNWMVSKNLDRVLSRDIVAVFNPNHTRPWEDLRRGREINEWWLGHKMSELGIRSKSLRFGELVGKGYEFHDIEAAFRRYVPTTNSTAPNLRPPARRAEM